MNKEGRKAAIAAYKERTPPIGIYAVRCAASGEVWVGASPNLDKAQNPIWFSLRMGSFPCRTLQASWSKHGESAFSFEIIERFKALEDEDSAYLRKAALRGGIALWCETLGGYRLA